MARLVAKARFRQCSTCRCSGRQSNRGMYWEAPFCHSQNLPCKQVSSPCSPNYTESSSLPHCWTRSMCHWGLRMAHLALAGSLQAQAWAVSAEASQASPQVSQASASKVYHRALAAAPEASRRTRWFASVSWRLDPRCRTHQN